MKVTILTALGCKPCERTKERLARLEAELPDLQVEEMDLLEDDGIELASRHRVFTLPLVLIDGLEPIQGEVSEEDLRAHLSLAREKART